MRKGRDGEYGMGKKWKRMTFIVATNVVASRPPERRPTGTPHARANFLMSKSEQFIFVPAHKVALIFPDKNHAAHDSPLVVAPNCPN